MADQGSSRPGGAPGFTELSHFTIDERSARLIDRDYCLENLVVVLEKIDPATREPVQVGMVRPFRRGIVQEISDRLRRPVRPVQLNAWEIRRALALVWNLGEEEREGSVLDLRPVAAFSFSPEITVPRILDEILGHAVEIGASDVHLEVFESDVDVRFRVDGLMRQIATPLSHDNIDAAISRLKVVSKLDVAERRKAQDGRIRAVYEDSTKSERAVDFRLSTVPGPFGEDAVLRILDSGTPFLGLDRLGFHESIQPVFERLIANPEGLLLVTGPTGSGKTTTLYSAIHHIRRPEIKILTAEDPIEYYFEKTCQKQVSAQMGFADYARTFMRQNPDVILIGEIRDEETASAAMRAAQTGHLVLSTLHTSDAVRTVSRLHTLGVDLNLISGSLLGALSQRLVRRLCPHCRQEAAPDPVEARRLGLQPDEPFFRAAGCEACRGGYKGRLGIYELFVPDADLADLIAEGTALHRLREAALQKGMRTLREDALTKARAGLTSLGEVLRTVPYRILEG